MADDKSKIDKKAEKARRREEKKNQKKREKSDPGMDSELGDEEGSKFAVFFVTFVIIAVWLAILVLLIKWDVGGFGSTVMTPILKNVPYVNKILPESNTEVADTETEYPYQTLDEAVAYIKELEKELQEAKDGKSNNDTHVSQLEAEVSKLKEYEANEAAFEEQKEKFNHEVVFSDKAPDIDEYKKFYEQIDPANAEVLYKQVVEQEQADSKIDDYVSSYSKMKPKQAAAIFDTMTDNLNLVADILSHMKAQARADILGNMNADTAAKITKIMNPSE